jgi:hypothetical protein
VRSEIISSSLIGVVVIVVGLIPRRHFVELAMDGWPGFSAGDGRGVIEGYSTRNPRPVVEMNPRTLETDEMGGGWTADTAVHLSVM